MSLTELNRHPRAVIVAAVVLVAISLTGCSQQYGASGHAIVAPPPDFGACSTIRQRFYGTSQSAISNERNRQSLEDVSSFANSDLGRTFMNAIGPRLPGGGNIMSSLASTLQNLSMRANEDTELIRQFAFSFDGLVQCRREEIAELRRDLRARRTTRAEATERASDVKAQAVTDAAVARDVNAQLSARTLRFQAAISDVDTQLGAEPAYSPRQAPTYSPRQDVGQARQTVAQVRQTVQTNQKALVTQAAAVDTSVRERAFDVISGLLPPRDVKEA